MEQNQILFKILSVGDSQTGKSCIIKKYCEGRFVQKYITTIGVDYGVKKMSLHNKQIAINFFDLSGDEVYFDIVKEFFKDSQGVILVVDLTSKESFRNIRKWEQRGKEHGCDFKKISTILVANKNDAQKKELEPSEVKQYANKQGYDFMSTSAATGENIQQTFDKLFDRVLDKLERKIV